jgi:hypothetical protein
MVLAVGLGVAVSQPPGPPAGKPAPPVAGGQPILPEEFVPRPSAISTTLIAFEKGGELPAGLAGRQAVARFVDVAPIRLLPLYVIEKAQAEAFAFRPIPGGATRRPAPVVRGRRDAAAT